uniref:DUF397 domain-containing protein n=1 Tax=Streptomyces sp. NBC_00049 TaxID=2903617 RepID=A0AAU2JNV8_9ACTN
MSTAPQWFKSSYSTDEGDACVEVATCTDTVHVRDSKVQDGPVLNLTPASWTTLTQWTAS